MGGHSHWANIKRKKGATDAKRQGLDQVLPRDLHRGQAGRRRRQRQPPPAQGRRRRQRRDDAGRHHQARHHERHRRTGRRSLRRAGLRGLRPRRGRAAHRGDHRQPQSHRRRRLHRAGQERRHQGRGRLRGLDVQDPRPDRRDQRRRSRRGHPDGFGSGPGRRGLQSRRRRLRVFTPLRAGQGQRKDWPPKASSGRPPRSPRSPTTWSRSTRRTRARCSSSSSCSRNWTTSRTCMPTSTSPTKSSPSSAK